MPKYEVLLARIVSVGEYVYVTVDADDEYHARALALDTPEDELDWFSRESWTPDGGEVEAETCKEVTDDQV